MPLSSSKYISMPSEWQKFKIVQRNLYIDNIYYTSVAEDAASSQISTL